METFAIICFSLLWLGIVGGAIAMIINGIWSDDTDIILAFMGFIALVFMLGITAVGFMDHNRDRDNPCVAWGPPVTSHMMIGKVMTPVTRTPCIQRQNETDK